MILPKSEDAIHKAWLYRVLSAIYDNPTLANTLYFKGGTCAAMLGYLDRFSVDLDFDLAEKKEAIKTVKQNLENIFHKMGLEIKDQSKLVPQYFLKYAAPKNKRNTIKIDITMPPPKSNIYEIKEFREIDRIIPCQTIETMFANKLVAVIDRFEKNHSIAGRDIYDIHHFFLQGFHYHKPVILERRKQALPDFFRELIAFIEKRVTDTIVSQDLNMLLSPAVFQRIRKILTRETLMFLNDELARLQ
ncbi:MAG TPA: nucleotidyl transferase AbiEii/AbiGii toxin family protein [Patescibacteria group bacterium]|nr:nucleotidyl transferase AbiEii/AbiGii toxin family protein [Patescibacteria group bacterium]